MATSQVDCAAQDSHYESETDEDSVTAMENLSLADDQKDDLDKESTKYRPFSDVILGEDEIRRIAFSKKPYFRIAVTIGNERQYLYLGTCGLDLLYGPKNNSSTNSSLLFIFKEKENYKKAEWLGNIFSSYVIPNLSLKQGGTYSQTRSGKMFFVEFQEVHQRSDIPVYYTETDPKKSTSVAIYMKMDSSKMYLIPEKVPVYDNEGHIVSRRNTIMCIPEDYKEIDKYVFSFSPVEHWIPKAPNYQTAARSSEVEESALSCALI